MKNARLAWWMAVTALPLCATAQEKVLVALPATFAFESDATAKLRRDCALAEMVGREVLGGVKERFPGADRTDDWRNAGNSPVLKISITHVQPGGSPSPIPTDMQNKMAIRAEIYRGAERWFEGDLRSGSAQYQDEAECRSFERIAVSLGKAVARWLPMALRVSAANRADAQSAAQSQAESK